ncbi:MAG: hypothetical protein ACREAE_09250 [Nitrosopumilaceae archaeon]
MKKSVILCISPLMAVAMAFCVTGMGMFGYLYYSDYMEKQPPKDGNIHTKLHTQKDVTVYEMVNKDLINNPTNFPSKIQIIDDYADVKNNVLLYDDIFRALWIPLLIIGSYILVHAGNRIVSKVRV